VKAIKGAPLVHTHSQPVHEPKGQAYGEDGTKGGDDAAVGEADEEEDHCQGDTDHGGEGGEDRADLREGREGGKEG